MATEQINEKQEAVKQHHRMAAGAWINGSEVKEQSKATMPEANSDHGNFTTNKGVDKRNA
jgi:hypothetical protein